jgi:hypothetical protein
MKVVGALTKTYPVFVIGAPVGCIPTQNDGSSWPAFV